MKNVHLVVIDAQNDFLAPPTSPGYKGTLYVKGAEEEALNLANMVDRLSTKITHIHSTLDSHDPVHIANPLMWKDDYGNHPNPFTLITEADVLSGRWKCALMGQYPFEVNGRRISYQEKCVSYVQQLAKNSRYPLFIWPEHCLIGSEGHNVYPPVAAAYRRWIESQLKGGRNYWIDWVVKGSWPFSEHYSAIQADVPEPNLPNTQINIDLLDTVNRADLVVLSGWAGSHCLANTGRDAVNNFGPNNNPFIDKCVLLTDTCPPVGDQPGSTMFADMRQQFIDEMKSRGMRLATTKDLLA